MKKICLLLLTLCLVFPLAACGNTTEDGYTVPDGFKLISNEISDFYMIVPEDWIVDISTGVIAAKCSEIDPTNITVITQALKDPQMTLDAYWETYGIKQSGILGEVTFTREGEALQLKRSGDQQPKAAKRYTYSVTHEAGEVYIHDQVVCLHNGHLYLITLTAKDGHYSDLHQAEFTEILTRFLFRK